MNHAFHTDTTFTQNCDPISFISLEHTILTVLCFEESTSFSTDCTCRMYQFADVVNLRVYMVSISSPEARAQNLLMADVERDYVSLK